MSAPLVSVVIPARNTEETIREAVESALGQTAGDLEVLVIDDASTDRTVEMIEVDDPRLRLISLESPSGSPAGPRNVGVDAARGSWIAFLDADDVWHGSKIEMQLTRLESSGTRACATNARRIPASGTGATEYFAKVPAFVDLNQLIRRNWVITSSLIADAGLVKRCLPFPGLGPTIYEDWAIWLRLARGGAIALLEESTLDYRDRPDLSYRGEFRGAGLPTANTVRDFLRWSRSQGIQVSSSTRALATSTIIRAYAGEARSRLRHRAGQPGS